MSLVDQYRRMRAVGQKVSQVLRQHQKHKRADRMDQCARILKIKQCECGCEMTWRTTYCRDRLCPVCSWRRAKSVARKVQGKMMNVSNQGDFILLTLTVKNTGWSLLKSELGHLHKAWNAFSKRLVKRDLILGWIRSTEVTIGRDGKAHPHLHVVLHVPHSARARMTQREWCEEWKEVMGLGYQPVLDVRWVNRDHDFYTMGSYLAKYMAKGDVSFIHKLSHEDQASYIEAVHGLRMYSCGGTLRTVDPDALSEDEMTAADEEMMIVHRHLPGDTAYCPQCGKIMLNKDYEWKGNEYVECTAVEWVGVKKPADCP